MLNRRHVLLLVGLLVLMALMVGCSKDDDDSPTGSNNDTNPTGLVTLTGIISDAVTGNPIQGVTVTLTGPTSQSVERTEMRETALSPGYTWVDITDSAGVYTFANVPSGNYSLGVTGSGFISATTSVSVDDQTQQVTITDNISISPEMAVGQYRFVLSWGETPYDLDAHYWKDTFHVYWPSSSRGDSTAEPFARLDIDDVTGWGPETITIYQLPTTGTCKYAIKNYSQDALPVGAHVDIYSGSSRIASHDVPTSGTGRWWYVCDLTSSGTLSVHNTILDEPPVLYTPPGPTAAVPAKSPLR